MKPTDDDKAAPPAPPQAGAVRGFAPTTRRRFLGMVLVAGAATVTVERVATKESAAPGRRPRWIGHC